MVLKFSQQMKHAQRTEKYIRLTFNSYIFMSMCIILLKKNQLTFGMLHLPRRDVLQLLSHVSIWLLWGYFHTCLVSLISYSVLHTEIKWPPFLLIYLLHLLFNTKKSKMIPLQFFFSFTTTFNGKCFKL